MRFFTTSLLASDSIITSLLLLISITAITVYTEGIIIFDNFDKEGSVNFHTTTTTAQQSTPTPSPTYIKIEIKTGEEEEEEEEEEIKIMTSASNNYEYEYEIEINKELDEMPLLPITSADTVHACRMLNINPLHDIFICSYPKSGTTWTQNIVVRLLWEITFNYKNKMKQPRNENKGKEQEQEQHDHDHDHEQYVNLPDDWHLSYSAPFYEADQYWKHNTPSSSSIDNNTDNDKSCDDDDDKASVYERIPVKTPIIKLCKEGQSQENVEYRVFNTHLRPNQLPTNAKCIYVIRNPLDVMISFYYHLSNQTIEDGGYIGTLQQFCKEFMDGTIVYGKWQDHIEAWLGNENKNNKNFLLLHYEDMKENLEKETKRIANFLLDIDDNDDDDDENENDSHNLNLNLNQLITQRVVPYCTFNSMKNDKIKYSPISVGWRINPKTNKLYNEFVRSGNIGDGKKECPIELKKRWFNCDVPIAKVRWNNANIDENTIINRYL